MDGTLLHGRFIQMSLKSQLNPVEHQWGEAQMGLREITSKTSSAVVNVST